jgi:hypothetical protein
MMVRSDRLDPKTSCEEYNVHTPQTLVHRYIDAWNERDEKRRRGLVDEIFPADAHYTDPLNDAAGCAAIENMIAGALAQFPHVCEHLAILT